MKALATILHNMRLLIAIVVLLGVVVIALAVVIIYSPARHDHCVVCKPSGKLAMWGECE